MKKSTKTYGLNCILIMLLGSSCVFGSTRQEPASLLIDAQNRIVVAGYAGPRASMVRYLPNGSLDSDFGLKGKVIIKPCGSDPGGFNQIVQWPQNKIMGMVGCSGYSHDSYLVQLNADGSLDGSFGDKGLMRLEKIPNVRLAVDLNGKLLVQGVNERVPNSIFISRYEVNGKLDPSFGIEGTTLISPLGDYRSSLTPLVLPEGKILLRVLSYSDNGQWTLMRLLSNGNLDSSFGKNGIKWDELGEFYRWNLTPKGEILVFGSDNSNDTSFVAQYLTDGKLDTHFGKKGMLKIKLPEEMNGDLRISSMINRNGTTKLLGRLGLPDNKSSHTISLNLDGSFDTSFSYANNAFGISDGSKIYDYLYDQTFNQSDGSVMLFGNRNYSQDHEVFRTMRLLANGNIDTSFGQNGVVLTDFDEP